MKVTALIPAFNEAERIGETLTAVLEIKSVNQIVVIDDGSTDETASVVERYPVELIRLEKTKARVELLMSVGRRILPIFTCC